MRFLLGLVFLVFIFQAQGDLERDSFVRNCENTGTIDVATAIKVRLGGPVADISTSLSKTYAECLAVALKYTGCKSKDAHEKIRKSLQCHLQPCVDVTFGATILADIGLKLSASVNNLRVKSSCNVISEYRRGSLNDVVNSKEVQQTLDKKNMKKGALGGLLVALQDALDSVFVIVHSLLGALNLENLLGGLITSVNNLLDKVLTDLDSTLTGESGSNSKVSESGSEKSRQSRLEMLNVYKCDLGTGSYKDYRSCQELSDGIDELISAVVSLRGSFQVCLTDRYKEIIDNCGIVLRKTC